MLNVFIIVYLDNILIYTKNKKKSIWQLFDRCLTNYRSTRYIPISKKVSLTVNGEVSKLYHLSLKYPNGRKAQQYYT